MEDTQDSNFTLNPKVNGPMLATFVTLEMLVSLSINLFILFFTISHYKILKQPANIFLTNFIVLNIGIATIQMSSCAITAATGEWLYKSSVDSKVAICYFVGFFYHGAFFHTVLTLTAISVDQFLLIVKPSVHKYITKKWIVILITASLWTVSGVMTFSFPFANGNYVFNDYAGLCIPETTVDAIHSVASYVIMLICIGTTAVTSVWTFIFVRKAIKPFETGTNGNTGNAFQHKTYKKRIKRIITLFLLLLITILITYSPVPVFTVTQLFLKTEFSQKHMVIFIQLFFVNTIVNPIIQSLFRKELHDFVVIKLKKICRRKTLNDNASHTVAQSSIELK